VSDFDSTPADSPSSDPKSSRRRRRGLIGFFALAGLAGALLVVPVAMAGARGFTNHGFGHCARGDAPLTETSVRERMAFGAARVLGHLDATDEQRAEVDAILDELAPQVVLRRAEGAELHSELQAVLAAEEIDADALEALRVEFLVHVDETSAGALGVLVELADVLTAEQRATMIDRASKLGFGPGAHGPL